MRMRSSIIIFFLSFFISFFLFSESEASEKWAADGNKKESFTEYKKWIEHNKTSNKFTSSLLKAAEISPDITESILLLTNNIKYIKKPQEYRRALITLGKYQELNGDISSAQQSFEKGVDIPTLKTDYSLLFNSAVLLLSLGEYDKSKNQLLKILGGNKKEKLFYEANILLAKIYLYKGESLLFKKAVKTIETGKGKGIPLVDYFLFRIDPDSLPDKKQKESPENMLQSGEISLLPTAENIFNPLEKETNEIQKEHKIKVDNLQQKISIQTGSFHDPENAEYLSKDLQKLGFDAFVEKQNINGKVYYKVLINAASPGEVPEIILKLKDKGFEGYPIY